DGMAVITVALIVLAIIGAVFVISHLHVIAVALAHLLHPHVLGLLLGAGAVLLLLAMLGFFWVAPAQVVAPARVAMRAEPGHAEMEISGSAPSVQATNRATVSYETRASYAKLIVLTTIFLGIAIGVALLGNAHFRTFLQTRAAVVILIVLP